MIRENNSQNKIFKTCDFWIRHRIQMFFDGTYPWISSKISFCLFYTRFHRYTISIFIKCYLPTLYYYKLFFFSKTLSVNNITHFEAVCLVKWLEDLKATKYVDSTSKVFWVLSESTLYFEYTIAKQWFREIKYLILDF